jgi:hypothetical protein
VTPHLCPGCGTEHSRRGAVYCTSKCQAAAQWRRLHPVSSPEPRPCAVCGEMFAPRYNDISAFRPKGDGMGRRRLYCSETCQNRASNLKRVPSEGGRAREREWRRSNRDRVNERKRGCRNVARERDYKRAHRDQARAREGRLLRIGDGVRIRIDDLPAEWQPVAWLVKETRREIENRTGVTA